MFSYSPASLQLLKAIHSTDRLSPYIKAAGSVDDGVKLYIWNTAISAAFYGPLQALEVGLRNALHKELAGLFGATWHDEAAFLNLNADLRRDIEETKDTLRNARKPIDTPHIVAGLNFGFWNKLIGHGPNGIYTTKLWKVGLMKAFPHSPHKMPGPAYDEVKKIRNFRNRIAHHEPIHYRNLSAEYGRIKMVASWMYPDLAAWIDYHSRCESVIHDNPQPRQMF